MKELKYIKKISETSTVQSFNVIIGGLRASGQLQKYRRICSLIRLGRVSFQWGRSGVEFLARRIRLKRGTNAVAINLVCYGRRISGLENNN